MQATPEPDVWVVARLAALERANRRLWIGLSALLMALVTLVAVGTLVATSIEVPAGAGGRVDTLDANTIRAGQVSISSALRIVDEQGRDLVFIGRDTGTSGGRAPGQPPRQALRLAASPQGSALSLGTPDGASSASLFVAPAGASLELRKGD